MEQNGFTVLVNDVQDITEVKTRYQVPPKLQSCHTAIVDGYIIEGHVPVTEIKRLLSERPDVIGLAVPGMPIGSPGMDGFPHEPYEVISFNAEGQTTIYASYP